MGLWFLLVIVDFIRHTLSGPTNSMYLTYDFQILSTFFTRREGFVEISAIHLDL